MASEVQDNNAIFTIISNNYFHYAKTLFDSIRNIPEYSNTDFYVAIVDKKNMSVDQYKDMKFIRLNDLDIDDIDVFLFKYNILEANTAVKPFVFDFLLKKYKQVIYFDPDICVYKALDFSKINTDFHIGILTPHITEYLNDDGKQPSEQTYLKYGLYNLGFITLFRNYKTAKFLEWWKKRLYDKCYNDSANGLFTDQKWIDLGAVLFKDFYISYDKSWNIAYWNLTERQKETQDPTFFHFSGLRTDTLSVHQTRFGKTPDFVKHLVDKYADTLNKNNQNYDKIRYEYDYFKDGSKVHQWQREFYKTATIKHDNPFSHSNLFIPENVLKYSNINNLGFYHNETPISGKYKWMQKCGYVKIPVGGKVRIVGYFDGYQVDTNILSFLINDKLVNTTILKAGEFDITFNIPVINNQILKIISSNSFIPKQEKIGEDLRELSVKIRSISIEDEIDNQVRNRYIINFENYVEDVYRNNGNGVNVFGYGNAETGIGQLMRGFDSLDMSVNNIVLQDLSKPNQNKLMKESCFNPDNSHNLFFINGDEDYLTKFPHNYFSGKYNIGYWNWELENLPDYWLKNEKVLQEIWCSSNFIQKAVSKKSKLPCVVIPPVIEFGTTKMSKTELGLPDKFIFLNIFDSKSVSNRKNPIDLINVFNQTFKNTNNVCLVIKTDSSFSDLKDYEQKDKIIFIRENWSKEKIHSLQYTCDCFVSLHRSEGFGLNIAESMYSGTPVIATGYSGNTDFCTSKNCLLVDYSLVRVGEGSLPYEPNEFWAQPDLEHASYLMRDMFDNDTINIAKIGKRGKDTIQKMYSKSFVLKNVKDRLFYIDAK